MKELFVFGVFVLFSLSGCLYGEEKISCDNVQDGLYIKSCREFYRCDNETYRHLPCPLDLVVNEKIMVCDYPEKVKPPCGKARNCTGIEDGRYPILDKQCRYYYTCHRAEYYGETRCQPGLVYNIMKDSCDWPYLTEEPCGKVKGSKEKSIPPRWEQRTQSPPTVPVWKPTDWPLIPEAVQEPTKFVQVKPEGF